MSEGKLLTLTLPKILDFPDKLLPVIEKINDYSLCLLEGGRGSGKSHSVARLILYVCEVRRVRVVCGRELQNNLEESVYAILKDLILQYNLNFEVQARKIIHKKSGSEITFRGFREQGNVNIKGLEGVDILWIDEAQSITKTTLDILMPTVLRREKIKVFFTMNRFLREDAVPAYCAGKENCLNISINYDENPFCPRSLIVEAEECKARSEADYRHIWLGEPIKQADDFVFNFDRLHAAYDVRPFGELYKRQRIIGIDLAAQGADQSVATILDRRSSQHWELVDRIAWQEPDTMVSVGRVVSIIGDLRPDVTVLDIGGLGKPIYDRVVEVVAGRHNIVPYMGATTDNVDTKQYANLRAQSYFDLKQWFELGNIQMHKRDADVVKELEQIRFKYRSTGAKVLEDKQTLKKTMGFSPDNADSLVMAVWGAINHLGSAANSAASDADVSNIRRKSGSCVRRA